jgi:hypothetical protein
MDGGNAGDCQEQSLPWTRRTRLAGAVSLAVWLVPLWVTADDGNLTQQLHAQQQQSRFQLMLEQVAKSARQRTAAAQSAPASHAVPATPIELGDWAESVRLQPVSVTDPVSPDSQAARRFQARQAHDRDQQRNLHHRQQRRALITGARTGERYGIDSFGAVRRELVRYNAQNQRQFLQRKLRR